MSGTANQVVSSFLAGAHMKATGKMASATGWEWSHAAVGSIEASGRKVSRVATVSANLQCPWQG